MTDEREFTPRLGRIRDQGRGSKSLGRSGLKKARARLLKPRAKSRFTGARYGRGAAARTKGSGTRHLAPLQRRRVIVKVHIARSGKSGPGLYRAHVSYLQRDGVGRDGEDSSIYDRAADKIDPGDFIKRSDNDPHHFRIIVSPEDGAKIGDLKSYTRAFMSEVERDLNQRVDWIAVDHHDTGHPHTHIIVRGKDYRDRDLVIAKDYLTSGLRASAEELMTQWLGPRRSLEIISQRKQEIDQERWTRLDRAILERSLEGQFAPRSGSSGAERFERSLQIARARFLESIGLAKKSGSLEWTLADNWQDDLKRYGRRGDIIRSLSFAAGERRANVRFVEDVHHGSAAITGTVKTFGPEDELRDTRFMLVEDFDGALWHVPSSAFDTAAPPPPGAVIEQNRRPLRARASDKVIEAVAHLNGGLWSEEIHAGFDPGARKAYTLALKRRLETLRRAGLVERDPRGVWHVGEAISERAAEYEHQKSGGVQTRVLSWLAPETQIARRAQTWLDTLSEKQVASLPRLQNLRAQRLAWLREEGLLRTGQNALTEKQFTELRASEFSTYKRAITAHTHKSFVPLEQGTSVTGKLTKRIDLAAGRFALLETDTAFSLVPWRDGLGRQIGKTLTISRVGRSINWTLDTGRSRGLSR